MHSMTGMARSTTMPSNVFSLHEAGEAMMDANRIKVIVLHGDPIARVGLQFACGRYADLEVRELPSFDNAPILPVAALNRGADVVVADYANGVTLASRSAGGAGKPARVVIVGGSDREWDIRRALAAGVQGYLLAGCAPDEIAAAVREVHRGLRHVSAQAATRLAQSIGCEALTTREEDVLRLVVLGLPNKTIAARLGIAAGTVKSHLKSTFGKLNVQSRTQAVALVESRGLLGAR